MLIKNKLIAKLLSNISIIEPNGFEKIRTLISDLICIGINEFILIKYSVLLNILVINKRYNEYIKMRESLEK